MKFTKIPGQNYEMMECTVTQEEWTKVMGSNPSYFKHATNLPVELVSWDDAQEFIKKLNEKQDSYKYALPTEEQWEYCCRAGSITMCYFGDDVEQLKDHAWYSENSDEQTHPVGQKKSNAWGLYDMYGNVWEWCENLYNLNSSDRVFRGGSWYDNAKYCRSGYRAWGSPSEGYNDVGFRLLRTPITLNTFTSEPFKPKSELSEIDKWKLRIAGGLMIHRKMDAQEALAQAEALIREAQE